MDKKHSALKTIFKASSKMASATMISRVLGLVREQVMASLFGASGLSDAFFVAYRIPNLLRGLFAEGAFSQAFVPTFIEAQERAGDEGARKVLWKTFFTLGLITLFLSALTAFFSEEIVSFFVNDIFIKDTKRFELAVHLTQVMSPYLCLTSLAAVFMGALNSYHSYFIPALAPAIFNIVVIISAFILPKYLDGENQAYYAISYGIVIGGLFQLLFQLPKVLSFPLKPTFKFDELTRKFQNKIIAKMGPGVLGTAAQHMNLLASTILATGSTTGAVSWLTYAFRLFQFPVGVIGVSIGSTFLVEFSRSIKRKNHNEALSLFKKTSEFSLMILIPITLVGIIGAEPLVRVVFQRGKFDAVATQQTALALQYYLLSLPLYGFYKNLNSSLYALERAKLPVIFSSFAIGINLLFCWFYIDKIGFQILALGNGITFSINIFLMVIAMKKIENWGVEAYFSSRVIKSLLAGILTYFLFVKYPVHFDASSLMKTIFYLIKISFLIFGCFYLLLLISGEWKMIRRIIKK